MEREVSSMTYRRRTNTTKIEIIQVATRMFLEKGYANTSIKAISEELDISTGNLTFYFPTKEHLLAILVEMLCTFQWKMMGRAVDEGKTSLMALCLELPTMAAICEENPVVKDFYLSSYTHSMTLSIIRRADAEKAKKVFAPYCRDWEDKHFEEAEILVSGIEYATLMTTPGSPSMDIRVAGALNSILEIYGVPKEVRKSKIQRVLSMDCYQIGRQVLQEFMQYIEQENELALEYLMAGKA